MRRLTGMAMRLPIYTQLVRTGPPYPCYNCRPGREQLGYRQNQQVFQDVHVPIGCGWQAGRDLPSVVGVITIDNIRVSY